MQTKLLTMSAIGLVAAAASSASAVPTFSSATAPDNVRFRANDLGAIDRLSVDVRDLPVAAPFSIATTGFNAANGTFVAGPFDSSLGATDTFAGAAIGGEDVIVSSTVTDNGDGTTTILISIATDGGEFIPAGVTFTDGSVISTLGGDLGFNASDFILSFDPTVDVADLTITGTILADGGALFSAATAPLDAAGDDITSGPVGDLSLEFLVGAGGADLAGLGGDEFTFEITGPFSVIPEPASVGLLSVVGLGLIRRRR